MRGRGRLQQMNCRRVVKYRSPACLPRRRGGRVAEGGGLLNRCTVKSCTGGSNPPLSASSLFTGTSRTSSRVVFHGVAGAKVSGRGPIPPHTDEHDKH